jgi:dinuclear metal center YbgI/SA1388 family protein
VPTIGEIVDFLERLAPPALAADWDNVGLLWGDRSRSARRALTCLTLTSAVAEEALAARVDLIVTHHPVLFRAVKRLTADDAQGKMLLDLAAARVAVYSPHTAYDSAAGGINQQLAELLGLLDIRPLEPARCAAACKIVCYVPGEHLEAVQQALWSAGAGVIGEYENCSFVSPGTGSFQGSAASNPAVGQAGRLEHVAEARLEVVCPESRVDRALRAMRGAHPYEEPAFDVYPLRETEGPVGTGRVGLLQEPSGLSLREFTSRVKERLAAGPVACTGELQSVVRRVAIVCGSGGEFVRQAAAAGCDALVTGEARFHTCLEALSTPVSLVLAGHYATERPGMENLARVLAREYSGLEVVASRAECDPLQWV